MADWLDIQDDKCLLLTSPLRGGGLTRQNQKKIEASKHLDKLKEKSAKVNRDVVSIPSIATIEKKIHDFKTVVETQGAMKGFEFMLQNASMEECDLISKEISKNDASSHRTDIKLKNATVPLFGTSLKDLHSIHESVEAVIGSCEASVSYCFAMAGTEQSTFNLGDLEKLVSMRKAFLTGQGYMG